MFASVRKERNGKGDGRSTTITPRALIHAQMHIVDLRKKQITGHKHIYKNIYIYLHHVTSFSL